MSRVGRRPIPLPKGVEVKINGNEVMVEGPKGKLSRSVPADMIIDLGDGVLTVSRPTDNHMHRAQHGLTRSLVANMVEGVSNGFQRTLELQGVGYRAQQAGTSLSIQVGYSKPVEYKPPEGVTVGVEGPTRIIVSGIDKEAVGQAAAEIRSIRPPDAYLGKGIRHAGEKVRRKAGKAGKIGKKK